MNVAVMPATIFLADQPSVFEHSRWAGRPAAREWSPAGSLLKNSIGPSVSRMLPMLPQWVLLHRMTNASSQRI